MSKCRALYGERRQELLKMLVLYVVGAAVSVALLVYLFIAMLAPESFQ